MIEQGDKSVDYLNIGLLLGLMAGDEYHLME